MPRRTFSGRQLAADAERLIAADRVSPPDAQPTLMEAVRQLATVIETRGTLGWSNSAIAQLLTEAGYPIDAATLRSYRKRLREEGRAGPAPEALAPVPIRAPTPEPQAAPTPLPVPPRPPPSRAAPSRTFSVSQAKLPPDRA